MAQSDEQLEKRGRKTSKPKSTTPSGNYSHRFIRFELSDQQKEEFKQLLADGEFSPIPLDHFDTPGYSFRSSSQNDGNTRLVTVTCSSPDDPNNGLMLTGRGRDTATAFSVCVYKDKYLAKDGVWQSLESSSPTDDIG